MPLLLAAAAAEAAEAAAEAAASVTSASLIPGMSKTADPLPWGDILQ